MNTLTQSKRSSRFLKSMPSKIAHTLRERIRLGHYVPGDRLPSERVLESDLNVDRRSIAMAIAQLIGEGLVERRRNCRPVVRSTGKAGRDDLYSPQRLPASRLIALIMSRESGFGCSQAQQRVFWGLNGGLIGSGLHVIFLDAGERSSYSSPHKAEREAEHLKYAMDLGFGGVVLYPHDSSSNCDLIQKVSLKVPLVLIDRSIPGVHADFVKADNRHTAFEATLRLIDRGHRRIALLVNGEYVQDRLQGYFQALHQAFPDEDPYEMVLTLPPTQSKSWAVLDAICKLPRNERPTAILSMNKHETDCVARHLEARKTPILEHPYHAVFDSTLSDEVVLATVVQPLEDIGKTAASLILRRYHDPSIHFDHIELS